MSFKPKKIETPYRVRVTGGRFAGAIGTVVNVYDDGVLGIDTDEGERAFASEEQIERELTSPNEFSDCP